MRMLLRISDHQRLWLVAGLTGATLLAGLTSCSPRKTVDPAVLARVGPREIRIEDFNKELERRRAARQPIPDKEALLQEMVNYEALLQRARQAGLEADPQVRRELNNLLIGRFQERELTPRLNGLQVTDDEVKAEYAKNIAKHTQPAKVRLALLVLKCDAKASDARRAQLRDRLSQARRQFLESPPSLSPAGGPPGFGSLAIDYSDDQASRYRGGDIGWLDAGSFSYHWPRAVLEAGYGLDKGVLSSVLEAEGSFYLVMKTESRAASVAPLERVAASIRQTLLVKKRHELEERFRQDTLRGAQVVINQKALASVEVHPSGEKVSQRRDFNPPALPGGKEPTHDN